MLFSGLLCVGLLLLAAPRRVTGKLQFTFVGYFDAPLRICRDFTKSLFEDKESADAVSRSEYVRLRNHLANNLQMLSTERRKVVELSGLSDRFVWKGAKFVAADIITATIDASRGRLIINRGTSDGLRAGQFVMGSDSIIGTVGEMDLRTASVLLTTDPSSETAVELPDADFCGVMRGIGNNSATIPLLAARHKVGSGDVVYARQKAGFLDNAVIAGVVSRCRRDDANPLLWDIAIEPACDVEALKKVVVIIANPQDQEGQVAKED